MVSKILCMAVAAQVAFACCTLSAAEVSQVSASVEADILRGLENTRIASRAFRMKGKVSRPGTGSAWNCDFVLESEAECYRIIPSTPRGSASVFDGKQLLCYDGRDSAIAIQPSRRATYSLAFDPRSIGVSTGLYSDLTLQENTAFRSVKDFSNAAVHTAGREDRVAIELEDRFAQRIRFEMQSRAPFRVFKYVKTILNSQDGKILVQYVAESEFSDEAELEWFPRKVEMYSLFPAEMGKKQDQVTVEFEKPDYAVRFDPEIWTVKGLSLPVGQPFADLETRMRIGYWDGERLSATLPRGRKSSDEVK